MNQKELMASGLPFVRGEIRAAKMREFGWEDKKTQKARKASVLELALEVGEGPNMRQALLGVWPPRDGDAGSQSFASLCATLPKKGTPCVCAVNKVSSSAQGVMELSGDFVHLFIG